MTTTKDSTSSEYNVDDVMVQSRKLAERMGIKSPSWFGIDLDADTRNTIVNPLWLTANSYAQGRWRGDVENIIGKGLDGLKAKGIGAEGSKLLKAPLIGKALNSPRLVATVFFGLLSASPMLPALAAPFNNWRKDRADMARTCAPVLQDMASEGLPHNIGAIGLQDNEVIYAHRQRINKTLAHITGNNALSLASSQVPTLLGAAGAKKGTAHKHTEHDHDTHQHHAPDAGSFLHMLPGAVDLVINKYTAARNKEMTSQQNSCSAYELIANLDEQIKKNGKGDILKTSISLPKAMGKSSCNLTDYIATIIKIHSSDMERMLPDEYSQLRDALKPQLQEVSKVLAEAIAAGDLSILSLIRMVGEGQIIKQQGRGLVDVEELKSKISKHTGKHAAMAEIDPKEYLKMATFKEKELKETLEKLEGADRSIFASMFPDAILKKVGISADKIKEIREETAPVYEKNLAHLLVGISSQSEEELKAQGLAAPEISEIKKAAKAIEEKGIEAVHTLRSNAVKPIGIELTAINAAMGKINEPHYFGKMLTAGQDVLSSKAANDDSYVDDKHMPKAGKVSHHSEAGNDADYGDEREGEGHKNRTRHSHDSAEHGNRSHQERLESKEHGKHHGHASGF